MSRKQLVPLNIPAFSTAPAGPNLVAGDAYYNSGDLKTYVYNGTTWTELAGAGGGGGGGGGGGADINLVWWFSN